MIIKIKKQLFEFKNIELNLLVIIIMMLFSLTNAYGQSDWLDTVRTTAFPLSNTNSDSIIKNATQTYISGIEVDNDIPGRYLSFLDPTEKLEAIKTVSEKAHKVGNHTFVYVAGLECITPDASNSKHTLFKDHPDWVQRDINGRPAKFTSKDAFWIRNGDEDVWVSPYVPEWRKIYMKRIRQIARTGVDGIYVDIPYWMTHFTGWEKTWASFDKYTVTAFKKQSGLNAKKNIKLGDFNDPGFVQWVRFRMKTITDFLQEINLNIKSVNPNCKLIPEIYPGLGEDPVVVGADVYQIYNVADAITHEYSAGKYYAAERMPFNWFNFIIGMNSFRAFAGDKPTIMLSYSWYNNKNIKPSEAMESLFASVVFSGANVWDAKGYVMSSSNDMDTRKMVYKWISVNSNSLYNDSKHEGKIGVYFSPHTRDMFPEEYNKSYRGMIFLLMNNHIDFQIVTPRTLKNFTGKILILDNVKCAGSEELNSFQKLKNTGVKFLITKNCCAFDENRIMRNGNMLKTLFNVKETGSNAKNETALYFNKSPGADYYKITESNLNDYFEGSKSAGSFIEDYCSGFKNALSKFYDSSPTVKIEAPINIISSVSRSNGHTYIYLINISELCSVCKNGIKSDTVKIVYKNSEGGESVSVTPYLGETYHLSAAKENGSYHFVLPRFNRGAVLRLN